MKRIATLILTIVTLTALGQIGSKIQQQSKVVGVWQNNQFGHQMTLMLNADGKGDFDGEPVRYTAKDGKLSLTIIAQNETTIYSYALNGNALVVSGGDLEQPITFTKTSSQAATSTAAGPTSITTPANSATSSTTLAAPAVVATTTTSTAQQQSALTPEQAILGTWTGNNESMEFRADGKCVCNGETIAYQVSKSSLVLNTAQGTEMMNYTINGNQLRTTLNGAQFVYTRVEPVRQGGGKQGPRGAPSSGTRSTPVDLVGKWCWINVNSNSSFASGICIALNGDGTYQYTSEAPRTVSIGTIAAGTASPAAGDQGKWWVEGDRIFYSSTTQGQGSYKLEKKNHPRNTDDPMIVLDGQPYMTSALRQPWK
jgi:hypothetical protein